VLCGHTLAVNLTLDLGRGLRPTNPRAHSNIRWVKGLSCAASWDYNIGDMIPVLEEIGSQPDTWQTDLPHDSWWLGHRERAMCSGASKTWEKMPLTAYQAHPPRRVSSVGAHCRTGKIKSRILLLTPTIWPRQLSLDCIKCRAFLAKIFAKILYNSVTLMTVVSASMWTLLSYPRE